MILSSVSNEKIKVLKKLQLKKYRDFEKKFIIEGEHLVEEAFKKGLLTEVYILEGYEYDFPIIKNHVTMAVMKKITTLIDVPNIIGVCQMGEAEIVGNHILLLDSIQDPGNLGTIIRNAVAFNVDTIILSDNTVDVYNPKVLRSAQGLNFHINIVTGDLKEIILNLKKQGFYFYGTSLKNKTELTKITKKEKWGLIVGNEGQGVSDDVLSLCDQNVYIQMNQTCESLNVGSATAIILYELDK